MEYVNRQKALWNNKLKLNKELKKTLMGLGITDIQEENFEKFNLDKSRNSYFPKLRIKGIILVDKLIDGEKINVCSIRNFPLSGEDLTIQEFINKLKTF